MEQASDGFGVAVNEGGWRWIVMFAVFVGVATWETLAPLREMSTSTSRRWTGHFALFFASTWIVALVLPFSAVTAAVAMEGSRYGLLNRPSMPEWAAWLVTVLFLDFVRYGQHWLLHRVPLLWRLHRVHHSDPDYDLTTGLRFHPLEALYTLGTHLAAIALLAPPPMAVFTGELIFLVQVHLAHGNVAFPEPVDRRLRLLLVTPNVHSIHHSKIPAEQQSNFGGIFSFWDRICRTFRVKPAAEIAKMQVGLEGFEGTRGTALSTLFLLPFRRQPRERS